MKTVVIGVDGSAPGRAAIRWGVAYAHERSATVRLVHVMDDEWGTLGTQLLAELHQGAQRLLDDAAALARTVVADIEVAVELRSGSPMWELSLLSSGDTLLVVGTHKTGFHYGRAFGSRSLQLASASAGPVAVIPESSVRTHRGVVTGVDDSAAGWRAIDLASDEADARDSELTLIRAAAELAPILDDDDRRAWMRGHDTAVHRLLAEAVSRVQARHPQLVTRSRLIRRPAGTALTEASRSAELLVIGNSRRSEFSPTGLGSVSYDVLLNLTCPTLVVHATH